MVVWWDWSLRLPRWYSSGGTEFSQMCKSAVQRAAALHVTASFWPLLRHTSGHSWQGHGHRRVLEKLLRSSCTCQQAFCRSCWRAFIQASWTPPMMPFLRSLALQVTADQAPNHFGLAWPDSTSTANSSLLCRSLMQPTTLAFQHRKLRAARWVAAFQLSANRYGHLTSQSTILVQVLRAQLKTSTAVSILAAADQHDCGDLYMEAVCMPFQMRCTARWNTTVPLMPHAPSPHGADLPCSTTSSGPTLTSSAPPPSLPQRSSSYRCECCCSCWSTQGSRLLQRLPCWR